MAIKFISELADMGLIRPKHGRRKRFINEERIVTEMPACRFVLAFRKHCLKQPEHCTTKKAFQEYLTQHHHAAFAKNGKLLCSAAVKAGYIRAVPTNPGKLQMGYAMERDLPYLELFRKVSRA